MFSKKNNIIVLLLLITVTSILPSLVLAQQAKSNTLRIRIGEPTTVEDTTPEGEKSGPISGVKDLVDKIIASNDCTGSGSRGVVNSGNVSTCVNSVNMSKIASDEIRTSASNYYNLQCVGFTKASVGEATNTSFRDYGVWNAKDYALIPPAGYKFHSKNSTSPKIGDIGVWGGSGTGHVAFVIDIDSRAFVVAEANWGSPGGNVKNSRFVDKNDPNFLGWVRKNE